MNIVSIVGARPQFIKAAAVSRKVREQHHAQPDANLGVGSGSHGFRTGAMLAAIENVLLADRPDYVLIYDGTNSTLAGALAASKLSIPIGRQVAQFQPPHARGNQPRGIGSFIGATALPERHGGE